jgi:hypothetical protein
VVRCGDGGAARPEARRQPRVAQRVRAAAVP